MADQKTVKGKVVRVQAAGHYTAQTGRNAGKTIYKFDVELDTEQEGQLSVPENELNGMDAPIAVGEIHEFSVYPARSAEYPDTWYLRKPKAEGGGWKGGGKQWTPDPEKESRKERWAKQMMITRLACLNTASSLISAGNGPSTVENLEGLAEQMEKWVCRGLQLSQFTTPKPALTPEPPKPAAKAQPAHIPDGEGTDVPF